MMMVVLLLLLLVKTSLENYIFHRSRFDAVCNTKDTYKAKLALYYHSPCIHRPFSHLSKKKNKEKMHTASGITMETMANVGWDEPLSIAINCWVRVNYINERNNDIVIKFLTIKVISFIAPGHLNGSKWIFEVECNVDNEKVNVENGPKIANVFACPKSLMRFCKMNFTSTVFEYICIHL